MVVIVERKRAENIVVLMHRVAEVASFLLVKIFAVRVAVLGLLGTGIDEAAVLCASAGYSCCRRIIGAPCSGLRHRGAQTG